MQSLVLDEQLTSFDLIIVASKDRSTDSMYERLKLLMDFLQLNEKKFYFMINEDQMDGFERLRSYDNFYAYYQDEKNNRAESLK